MKKLTHPLSLLERHGIHILFGGSEAEVFDESVDLVRDIFHHGLKDDEEVLYINTMSSASDLGPVEKRITRDLPLARRFNSITLLETSLAEKLDFLRNTIRDKGIKYLILNSFEFGALTSRHRMQVFFWLKSLRDAHKCRVIIFTQSGPRRYGTLGQMRFVSASCEAVGAYLQEKKPAVETAAPKKSQKPEKPADGIKRDENGEPIYYIDRQKILWAKEKEERERAAKEAANRTSPETETLKTKGLDVVNVTR